MSTIQSFQNLPNPFKNEIQRLELKIGPYELAAIPTGLFGLDGGAMFGTVPKVLWEKTNPADFANRIAMEARALLLRDQVGKRCVLIDCGIGADFIPKYGEKLGSKFQDIYAVEQGGVTLTKSLAAVGLKESDITDVILTHLHFDHAGGGTRFDGRKLVPTFPNAKYYVQRRNLEIARNPNRREKASYFAAQFEPLEAAGQLVVVDGPTQNLLPMISVGVSHGHTEGHQYVRISDGATTAYYCGDVIPTSSHIRLPWVMGYDLRPLDLIEEKATLLAQAVKENAYLYFEHDPYLDLTQVESQGGDFAAKGRFRLIAKTQ